MKISELGKIRMKNYTEIGMKFKFHFELAHFAHQLWWYGAALIQLHRFNKFIAFYIIYFAEYTLVYVYKTFPQL